MPVRNTFNPDAIRAAVTELGRQGIVQLGKYAVERILVHCPVDSGHMRSTIHLVYEGDPDVIRVVCTAYYSPYVEFGHLSAGHKPPWHPPNPFFRPGLFDAAAAAPELLGSVTLARAYQKADGSYYGPGDIEQVM